jgi:AraC-like DNA-binding protein
MREFKIILSAIPLSLIIGVFFLLSKETEERVDIYPSSENRGSLYIHHDGLEKVKKGNSKVLSFVEKDSLLFAYHLGDSREWPYVGVGVRLGPKGECLSLQEEDSLFFDIRAERSYGVEMQWVTRPPVPQENEEVVSVQSVAVSKNWRKIGVAIKHFTVPQWWRKKYADKIDDIRVHLDRSCSFEYVIGKAFIQPGSTDSLWVKNIYINRHVENTYKIFLGWVFTALSIILGGLLAYRFYQKKVNHEKKKDNLVEKRTKLESADDEVWNNLIQWFGENYNNANISMEDSAKETGVGVRRMQQLFKKNLETTPKSWLQELRLKEAAKLLLESEDRVSDIAYNVGFNTPSHFNRAFKSKEGCSPSEYRNKGK